MAESESVRDKLALFEEFESTLLQDQRHFLLRNPDLLSADLIGALYRASLNRMSQTHTSTRNADLNSTRRSRAQVEEKKPRKVVNSWMAFRSYYSPLIKDLPQKARSPMLALLWKNDVDHGLWELLSAAFSHIRDNHSEDAVSLEQFLGVAAQVVPIITADQYFARRGWTRIGDVLQRVDSLSDEPPKATNVSCAGLARYCYRQGLISRPPTSQQADFKPTKSRRATPSRISFASVASGPMGDKSESQPHAVRTPQQIPASDDIELQTSQQYGSVSREGFNSFEDSSTSNSPMPFSTDAAVDSPFSVGTIDTDALRGDMFFNSPLFKVDDYWGFSL